MMSLFPHTVIRKPLRRGSCEKAGDDKIHTEWEGREESMQGRKERELLLAWLCDHCIMGTLNGFQATILMSDSCYEWIILWLYDPYFTDEKSDFWNNITCAKSQTWAVVVSGFKPNGGDSRAPSLNGQSIIQKTE